VPEALGRGFKPKFFGNGGQETPCLAGRSGNFLTQLGAPQLMANESKGLPIVLINNYLAKTQQLQPIQGLGDTL
jgi:hypothetical protein